MVSFLWRSWKRSAINASRISAQKRNAGKKKSVSAAQNRNAGKKKSVPATDSFVAEDYSMDIDCVDEDLPIDDGVNHDVTAKPLGIFFAFFKL